MKKKFLLLLTVAAACVLMMTACTSSENINGNTSGSGETMEQSADHSSAGQSSADNSSSANVQEDISAPIQGEPGYDGEPDGEIFYDEDAEAAENENAAADIWSGSYQDTDESVSVQLMDNGNISFSFAQSGISGTAEVNGTQAVFHGDDYHVVVFNVHGDTLDISVSSEEDFDTSSSPLNGTYTKQ